MRVSNVRMSTRLSHTKDTNSCFAGIRACVFIVDVCIVDVCIVDVCIVDVCIVDVCIVDVCIVDVCMWSCARTHAPRAHTWVLCAHTGVLAVLTVGILIAGYGHTAMHSEHAAHMLHGVFMYLTLSVCVCVRMHACVFVCVCVSAYVLCVGALMCFGTHVHK